MRPLVRALAPYLAAQLVMLALVVVLPGLAHLAQPKGHDASPVETKLDDDAARKKFNDMLKLPPPEYEYPALGATRRSRSGPPVSR